MGPAVTQTSVRAHAVAQPGLLTRFAAVLNAHPVSTFHYTELPDGTATLTVSLAPDPTARGEWHLQRIVARLNRVVGVLSVDTSERQPG